MGAEGGRHSPPPRSSRELRADLRLASVGLSSEGAARLRMMHSHEWSREGHRGQPPPGSSGWAGEPQLGAWISP